MASLAQSGESDSECSQDGLKPGTCLDQTGCGVTAAWLRSLVTCCPEEWGWAPKLRELGKCPQGHLSSGPRDSDSNQNDAISPLSQSFSVYLQSSTRVL